MEGTISGPARTPADPAIEDDLPTEGDAVATPIKTAAPSAPAMPIADEADEDLPTEGELTISSVAASSPQRPSPVISQPAPPNPTVIVPPQPVRFTTRRENAPPRPSPLRFGGGGLARLIRFAVSIAVLAALFAGATSVLGHHSSQSSTVVKGGSTTDGVFTTGDCVNVTGKNSVGGQVTWADCSGPNSDKVTAVLHNSGDVCLSGSEEIDLQGSVGNLCVARGP
jgi:hypothetical protein